MNLPQSIIDLMSQRDEARKAKDFALSDKLRAEIESQGYIVEDSSEGTKVSKPQATSKFVVLFGSGETSTIGRAIHEHVFQNIGLKDIKIGIISTPAGFQPNVTIVHEEIKDFFTEHLSNFHPSVKIIYANTKKEANDESIASQLEDVDYIFMGPGSPTYAVKVLRDSLLLEKIMEKVEDGASLSLSSAAALAFSQFCLPVYEIYKVGTDLYWENGLDLYQNLLKKSLTIIPHFDNTEGGEKTDTSRCFMGQERFVNLLNILPEKNDVIGIDEQTAEVYNLTSGEKTVMGKGKITNL